jgi:hypothetical protein
VEEIRKVFRRRRSLKVAPLPSSEVSQ